MTARIPLASLLLSATLCGCLAACSGGEGEAAVLDGELARAGGAAAAGAADSVCTRAGPDVDLPREMRESSGLALGQGGRVLWTHNDAGNEPELFAIAPDGRFLGRSRLIGASLVDWEDIEAAPCGQESCLWVGDIGDNDGERDHITVYRVVEPRPGADASVAALHARYPDGPRDAEALFAGPDGDLYVVTKGRRAPIALYRWPASIGAGQVTLEHVRDLFPEPDDESDRVTAATASPAGDRVAIRTYRTVHVYPMQPLISGAPVRPASIDLSFLGQAQGEAIALGADGAVWLTSEAEDGGAPRLTRLRCRSRPRAGRGSRRPARR